MPDDDFVQHVQETLGSRDACGESITELKSLLIVQETTIASLRHLLCQAQAEISSLKQSRANSSKENMDVGNIVSHHELDRKLRMTELKNGKLAMEIHRIEDEKRRVESTVSTYKSKLSSASSEREMLRKQLECENEIRKKLEHQTGSLNRTVAQLREALAKTELELKSKTQNLLSMISSLEHERMVTELTDRLGDAVSDSLEYSGRICMLERQLESVESKCALLETEIKTKSAELVECESTHESTRRELLSLQHQNESLILRLSQLEQSHRDELSSIETSHSIAISLLEQSTASALSRASTAAKALEACEQRLSESLLECESVKKEFLVFHMRKIGIDCGSNACLPFSTESSQTDPDLRISVPVQTDSIIVQQPAELTTLRSLLTCNVCESSLALTSLCPCGHTVCDSCLDELLENDQTDLSGISCPRCADNLPVTKFFRNPLLPLLSRFL